MPYDVKFHPEAEKDLAKLTETDKVIAQRILSKIKWLAVNCPNVNHEPLSGDLAGLFKRHVGDYRVIYLVDTYNQAIEIFAIGHRRDIYKTK
jgi:mRNA interferase RelE/StbE